jgi:hypothetical protein
VTRAGSCIAETSAKLMAENKTTFNVDTKYCEYVLIGEITVNVYPQKGIATQFS